MAEQTSRGRLQFKAVERLLLANQFAILERLYPTLRHEFATRRQIIEREDAEHYGVLLSWPVLDSEFTGGSESTLLRPTTDRGGALTPW